MTSAEEVTELLSKDIRRAEIKVLRDGEEVSLTVIPVKDVTTGKPRVGVLVRDSLSGVGTVTYINGTDGTFASLGHPVTDTAGNTTKINGGTLYGCIIYDVKRGVRGNPGELKGAFQNSKSIGVAALNCDCGVFGDLEKNYDYSSLTPVQASKIEDVTPGKAVIYSTVSSNKTECYEISIVKVDKTAKDNRNFVIKIEDEDLIERRADSAGNERKPHSTERQAGRCCDARIYQRPYARIRHLYRKYVEVLLIYLFYFIKSPHIILYEDFRLFPL